MKRFKIFFLNSILIIVTSIILQILKLIFNIYVSNKMSTEAFGVLQLILVTYSFGITLASSGINISCMRIVSEELTLGNNYGVKKSSKTCIKICLFCSLIASIFFCTNADFIVKYCFKSKIGKSIVYLICSAFPLISVSSALTGYFMAVRRVYKTILGQFLEQFSKFIAIIILLNNFTISTNSLENMCFSLILGDVISEFIAFSYLMILYFFDIKKYFSKSSKKYKKNYIYRISRILLPVAFTSWIKSGLSTIKQLIIPSSLTKNGETSEKALSDYGIISGMAMPIIMFPATFLIAASNLLIPEFSRYYVKKDYKKIKLYTDKLLIYSFIFSLFLAIIFFTFADKIGTTVYHKPQVGSYIKLLSLLVPFMYVDIIIDNILKGLDMQKNIMVINIIDSIISISFIFLFVPIFGIKAYIISIFISEILNLCLSLKKLIKFERSW